MCFQLYAGTLKSIPRSAWQKAAPDINVADLSDAEAPIRAHFSRPEVQYIGSTSNCGCDFPHLMYQNGGWPTLLDKDPETAASDSQNQEALVALLRGTGEKIVELYGIWSADFSAPKIREEILLDQLLKSDYYFKEQGFLMVLLQDQK